MKIKRFNNLWTMGLIILIGILVAIYCVKIINPTFIVGVAESESIVRFGTYIDSHKWAYYLFAGITSFIMSYLYCGACCKKIKLNLKDLIVVISYVVISILTQIFMPRFFSVVDICLMILMPMIINLMDKNYDANKFYSFGITFIVNNIAQIMSLQIRDIATMISYPNSATYIVLLIDAYIWLFIMFNLFNFKKEK